MVAVVAVFLAWDRARAWEAHLYQRREALRAEAEGMASAIGYLQGRPTSVLQQYVDDVCGRMREASSPGHHIVLTLHDRTIQASAHRTPSDKLARAIQATAESPGAIGSDDGHRLVVGAAHRGEVSVFVAEYLVDIEEVLRAQVLRRTLNMLALGFSLVLVVNLAIARFVTRPLNAVVNAVHRISRGEVGAQAPTPATRELGFLADEFNAMSSALARVAFDRRRQMDKARRIQERLAPSGGAASGLSVMSIYEPAEAVAGDYYDFRRLDSGVVVFCLADVSGHGVPAALLAGMLKSMFTSACEASDEPRQIVALVNQHLAAVTLEEDFASMIVVAVDAEAGQICWVSAGHEPAYLLHTHGDTDVLSATGPILGVQETGQWEQVTVRTQAGDRLVMLTDGLAELNSAAGEPFGRQRVRRLLEDAGGEALDGLRRRVLEVMALHLGDVAAADDVTVLAVQL
jgi:HAMP domain-containing protein